MKLQAFKRLIKEAVAEAIYEEMPTILSEIMAQQNKRALTENKSFNFSSNDIQPLAPDVRRQLADKMGSIMGFSQAPQTPQLKVLNPVDESTGQSVNPFLEFIADAANNMTAQDKAGLRNLE